MENAFFFAVGSSLWLGVLTSLSPCPLAANITAVSFIGKNIDSKKHSILSGITYALGRMLVYSLLSAIIVSSIISIPALSMFLQTKMNNLIGPILIITGLLLLGVIKLNIGNNKNSELAANFIRKGPYIGSILIGALLALSFCPISAAFFFGSMIPISIKHDSFFIIPAAYGVGTALPVVLFAILISLGTNHIGTVFNKITTIELWIRKFTGAIFVLIGTYYVLTYIFKINMF
jgi:hypothetical protein